MKLLTCACEHCGGNIEYPGSAIDTVTTCPHCGEQTTLTLGELDTSEQDEAEAKLKQKIVITVVVFAIVLVSLAVAYWYMKSKTDKGNRRDGPKTEAPAAVGAPVAMAAIDLSKHRSPLEASTRGIRQDIQRGRQVYRSHCSECHVFHDPAAYSNEEWNQVFNKMVGKAKLGRDEREQLDRFIATARPTG